MALSTHSHPTSIKTPTISKPHFSHLASTLWRITKYLILLLLLAAVTQTIYQNVHKLKRNVFDPDMTSLYSTQPNTWIFRGNTPTKWTHFDISQLTQTLKKEASTAGHPLPEQFRIIDISLLRDTLPFYEAIQAHSEKSFFKQHPELGKVINIPLNLKKTDNIEHYDYTATRQAVFAIQEAKLSASSSNPVVIYVHCEHGIDRTGAVLATYSALYANMSPSAAIKKADQTAKMKDNAAYTVHQLSGSFQRAG